MLEQKDTEREEAWDGLASILKGLPLDKLTYERKYPVKMSGYRSPQGQSFQTREQFVVYSDHFEEGAFEPRPEHSLDLLIAEYQEEYKTFLEEASGNKEIALQKFLHYVHDEEDLPSNLTPPSFFYGKWLVINPDLLHNSEEIEKSFKPSLLVRGDIQVWEEGNYGWIQIPSPGTNILGMYMYNSPITTIHFSQAYAEAVLGHCQIDLVETPEKIVEFYAPNPTDNRKIDLPDSGRVNSEDYYRSMEEMTGYTWTKEDRLAKMRSLRRSGFPFSDDPLENFVFPKNRVILPKKKRRDRFLVPNPLSNTPDNF